MITRLRALPLMPPPVHGETVGSYLNRLADANHLTIGHLSPLTGPPLRQRWKRRLDMLGEDQFGDPHRPSEARIELVTHPEAVVLTGLFASPHWRDHPQLPTEAARRFGIAPQQFP